MTSWGGTRSVDADDVHVKTVQQFEIRDVEHTATANSGSCRLVDSSSCREAQSLEEYTRGAGP
jgi:hypothetical protein